MGAGWGQQATRLRRKRRLGASRTGGGAAGWWGGVAASCQRALTAVCDVAGQVAGRLLAGCIRDVLQQRAGRQAGMGSMRGGCQLSSASSGSGCHAAANRGKCPPARPLASPCSAQTTCGHPSRHPARTHPAAASRRRPVEPLHQGQAAQAVNGAGHRRPLQHALQLLRLYQALVLAYCYRQRHHQHAHAERPEPHRVERTQAHGRCCAEGLATVCC